MQSRSPMRDLALRLMPAVLAGRELHRIQAWQNR
jgi:hypothetical protein